MAKVGEGDPRWIVTNREDGRNVNQWHWEETDYTSRAKAILIEDFGNINISSDKGKYNTLSKGMTVEGEVSVNMRKKKIILLYELDISIPWEGYHKDVKDSEELIEGTVHMPYISEENDDDDFEVKVSVKDSNKHRDNAKDEFRKLIIPVLKEKIAKFLQSLRTATSSKKNVELTHGTNTPSIKLHEIDQKKEEQARSAAEKKTQKPVSTFKLEETFQCSPRDLYACFTEDARVKAFAGGDSKVSPAKSGEQFTLFGGSVSGHYTEVVENKCIKQRWRFSSWPEGQFSSVTLEFEEKDGRAILKLKHEGVPPDEVESCRNGWQQNFFTRIKGCFGYGAMNFS